jgi:hypothetical protein
MNDESADNGRVGSKAVIGHDRWYPNEAQLAMKVEAHPA